MFITAVELLGKEISKYDIFNDKKIEVLVKPLRLDKFQNSLLNLAPYEIG
jgi:hypothetical protein